MSNILTIPASGSIIFNDGTAGSSSVPDLTGNAVSLNYDAGAGLNITSYNTTNAERFSVDGTEGRLFSVSDSLTGDIFSVNDIAGLPLINVYSDTDDIITIGTYSSNALVVKNDKVGIGTDTPSEALTVSGNISASGSLSAASANITGDLIVDTNTLYVDSADNRVGIGTTDPTSTLHVVGNSLLGGTVTTTSNLLVGGAIIYMNLQQALTQSGPNNLTLGNAAVWSTITYGHASATKHYFVAGNVGIGTDSPSEKLTVSGNISASGSLSAASANITGDLTVDTDTLYVDSANGRVGIGTTSPNYKLDVDDTIGVGNSLIVNYVPETFPRVFPPVTIGGLFGKEPTGRVGVVNDQDSGEWAFCAVSVADDISSNRSGLLHSNANAYRLILANTTEENIRLNSDGDSFLKGRVAIGHDTPTEALDVDGIVKVSNRVKTNQISVNSGNEIKLNQATFFNNGNICNNDYQDIGATLHLRTNEPLADQSVIAITRGGQGTSYPSGITQNNLGDYTFLLRDRDNNSRIRFVANNLSSGDSLIDSRRIVLCGNTYSQDGSISIDGRKWSDGLRNALMVFKKSGTQADTALEFRVGVNLRGSISYSDTGTAYNVTSDYRLKENVVEITDGIERLKQLKPSKFNFISNPDKVVDGFIAHEVESVVPEAVTGTKDATEEYEVTPAEYDDYGNLVSEAVIGTRDAYQQIDQAKIVPLLTAALQEAVAKIESLEARIQTLEGN